MDSRLFPDPAAPSAPPGGATSRTPRPDPGSAAGSDTFSFADFIDIINPLQHIPLVSTLYRDLTGDTIRPGPRIVGDGLFGGPIGLVAGILNAGVQQVTGEGLGAHAMALLGLEPENGAKPEITQPTTLATTLATTAPPDGRDPGQGPGKSPPDSAVSDWARAEIDYRKELRAAADAKARDTGADTPPAALAHLGGAPGPGLSVSVSFNAPTRNVISDTQRKYASRIPAETVTRGRFSSAMINAVALYEKTARNKSSAAPARVNVLN